MKMIIPTFEDFVVQKYNNAMLERSEWGEETEPKEFWLERHDEWLKEEYLLIAKTKEDFSAIPD
jgi:hypothetical protein|tara:strand:- start:459 stop:650 length:192 start_codon:yes stop_codon:yes gene_type:complete